MDIVKRAYLKTLEETDVSTSVLVFQQKVKLEVIRLIQVRAYSGRDWPWELGPMPDRLRAKAKAKQQ